ncbi:MAG: sulfur carrier protein ThiS [Alphaproteobacteria bacterium]
MTAVTAKTSTETAAETILVNGEPRAFRDCTLADLVAGCGIDPKRRGLAVAVNRQVVPRVSWEVTHVAPGDRVEIVQPLAGG